MLADKLEEGTPKEKPSGEKLISRFAGSEPTIQQNLYKLEPEEFDLIEDSANRMGTGVTYTHLKKLKDQMVDDGGFSPDWPITVDQNGLISDGHTRFRAAKELQIPAYFIEKKDATTVQLAKQSSCGKKWSVADWVRYYSASGEREYKVIEWYMEEYDVTVSLAITILCILPSKGLSSQGIIKTAGTTGSNPNVRIPWSPTFETPTGPRKIGSIIELARQKALDIVDLEASKSVGENLNELRKLLPEKLEKLSFQRAYLKLQAHQDYNHNNFTHNCREYSGILHNQPTVSLCLKELAKLYNYNRSKPNLIRLDE